MRKLVAAAPALALLAGCPSFSTMGTARTLPKGETGFHVALGGQQLRQWEVDASGSPESLTIPAFEIGLSHAVSDSVEVGGKIWFLGAEINSKFQLRRSPSPDSGLDLALAPAISFFPLSGENNAGDTTTGGLAFFHLPLLLGVNVGGGSQLVLGPRISNTLVWGSAGGSSESASIFWAGGSLGFAFKIGDSFRILPEVAIAYPFGATTGTETTLDLAFKGALIQAQLGLVFGK